MQAEETVQPGSWRGSWLRAEHHSAQVLADLKFAIDQAAIVSISDPNGEIIYANDLALKTYGYSRQELIGRNHRILNSGVHPHDFFRELWETILAGRVWRGDVCNKAKDGSLYWLDTTIVPFLKSDGKPYQFMAIRTDITDRKRIGETLEYERRKRSAIERLSAVGEMAASIAHEVRNPLAGILLQTQLMRRRGQSGSLTAESVLPGLEKIEQIARRMEKILAGLLSLSRDAESDPMECVNIRELIKDTLDFCAANFEKRKISVILEPASREYLVECRPTQISQVLLNLLNNARDAIENLDERWIRISAGAECGMVRIRVTDSGTGLSPKLRARIMDPFFTTKGNGKGTGLGLSISRKILESHGGDLSLESTKNTSFMVKLREWSRPIQ